MIVLKGWRITLNKGISILLFFVLISGIYSCKKQDIVKEENPTTKTEFDYYFPLQTDSLDRSKFPDQQGKLHPDINRWFSEYLQKMEEPNFYKKIDSGYIIRYTILPSFTNSYTYRIQKSFNDWYIHYKEIELLTTSDSYEPGEIVKDTLVAFDWHTFYQLEQKLKQFDLPNHNTHNQMGLDGDIHILEVYKNGDYQFIQRWSPREEDEKEFIELTKMIENIYLKN